MLTTAGNKADWIYIVAAVAYAIFQIVSSMRKNKSATPKPGPRRKAAPVRPHGPVPADDGELPPEIFAPRPVAAPVNADREQRARALALGLGADGEALHARAEALAELVRLERALTVLRAPVLKRIVPGTQKVVAAVRAAATEARVAPLSILPVAPVLSAQLSACKDQIAAAETLAAVRRQPGLLALLGDADALLDACWEPVRVHAKAQGLPLADVQPLTVPLSGGLAITLAFAEAGLAPVALPAGFARDVRLWPALAHEVGHLLPALLPGLRAELRAAMGLPAEPRLERSRRPNAIHAGQVRGLLSAWIDEVFADLFGALMLGPASFHTALHVFSPEPHEGQYRPGQRDFPRHPPAALRLMLIRALLQQRRLDEGVAAPWQAWLQRAAAVGQPGVPVLTAEGASVRLRPEALEPLVNDTVAGLLGHAFEGLGGFQLADIPGLAMGPARLRRARESMQALYEGEPYAGSPLDILAGAVLTTTTGTVNAETLLPLVLRSVRGIGTGEASAQSAPAAAAAPVRPAGAAPTAVEWRDAVLLQALLGPGPGRARHRELGRNARRPGSRPAMTRP